MANDGYGVMALNLWCSSESLRRLVKKYVFPDATKEDIQMAKRQVKDAQGHLSLKNCKLKQQ